MDGAKTGFSYWAKWCVYRRNVIGAVSQAGLRLLLPIRGAGKAILSCVVTSAYGKSR